MRHGFLPDRDAVVLLRCACSRPELEAATNPGVIRMQGTWDTKHYALERPGRFAGREFLTQKKWQNSKKERFKRTRMSTIRG